MLITIASIVLAFIVGALLMIFSDTEVRSKFAYFFARPADALIASWDKVSSAYGALIMGAIGGYGPITETTASGGPLICAGSAWAWPSAPACSISVLRDRRFWRDRGCLYRLHLAPAARHPLLLAILGGLLGGAAWGGIVGWLKAKTGAHEVIVTIMMNYIAAGLLAYLLTTPPSAAWADRPDFPHRGLERHHATARRRPTALGFVLALLAAVAVWWILDRSTTGFAIRAVGANPHAAATAGMSVGVRR